jgi:hypothetical protein
MSVAANIGFRNGRRAAFHARPLGGPMDALRHMHESPIVAAEVATVGRFLAGHA